MGLAFSRRAFHRQQRGFMWCCLYITPINNMDKILPPAADGIVVK